MPTSARSFDRWKVWAAHEGILRKHKNRWYVVQNGAGGAKIDYANAKNGAVLSQISQ